MSEADRMRVLMTGPSFYRRLALSEAIEQGALSTTSVWHGGKGALATMLDQLKMEPDR